MHGLTGKPPSRRQLLELSGLLCNRIFSVMGMPNSRKWPELESLPSWLADTEGVRTSPAEYPAQSRLAEHVQLQCKAVAYQPRSTALELLAEMLAMDPSKRVTARQALQHPYFKQALLPLPAASPHAPCRKQDSPNAISGCMNYLPGGHRSPMLRSTGSWRHPLVRPYNT